MTFKPVQYWAQSTDKIFVQVKQHLVFGDIECKLSFDKKVELFEDSYRVTSYCYEGENAIKFYDTGLIKLADKIDLEASSYKWDGERAVLTLGKVKKPSFQKYLMADAVQEAKEIMVWWDMRDKYIEELEEFMEVGEDFREAEEE